jgi:hypothetical protein
MKVRVAEYGYIKGVNGSLEMRMVRVQEGGSLSATADSLNPEEICHGWRPSSEALFPTSIIYTAFLTCQTHGHGEKEKGPGPLKPFPPSA